jgi:hypothetical protein
MGLGISSPRRLPSRDRSVIRDPQEEPAANRVRERRDHFAQTRAFGRLLLALDEEMLPVRDQAAYRRIIDIAEGEASQPFKRRRSSLGQVARRARAAKGWGRTSHLSIPPTPRA